MTRVLAFVLFVLAAVLAFIDDFAHAHVSLLFIIGVIAAGLACLAFEWTWTNYRGGPPA